jgi:hypothetical protein
MVRGFAAILIADTDPKLWAIALQRKVAKTQSR